MRVRSALVSILLLSFAACGSPQLSEEERQEAIDTFNYVAGTQTMLSVYQFTDETLLVETAKGIRNTGSNTLKLSLTPRYNGVEYRLPKNEKIVSLRTLAELEPSIRQVFDMDFTYYLMWAYCFSEFRGGQSQQDVAGFIDGFDETEAQKVYDEIYEFSQYLLTTYSGTGKVLYVGHWEGDWHLRWDGDRKRPLEEETIENMIRWLNTRQRAIDDAKRDTPHSEVELYHYSEANLVRRGIEGHPCLTTEVLPRVDVDYVSYSTWDSTNKPKSYDEMVEALGSALDFIESQLQPKQGLPEGRRVWVGEFGFPAMSFSEEETDLRTKWVVKACLQIGSPFALYWEFYNNEKNPDGSQRGYWMIDDSGEPMAVHRTYVAYYQEARKFVGMFIDQNGRAPTTTEFSEAAVAFSSLQ
jgi:hypothetical protein